MRLEIRGQTAVIKQAKASCFPAHCFPAQPGMAAPGSYAVLVEEILDKGGGEERLRDYLDSAALAVEQDQQPEEEDEEEESVRLPHPVKKLDRWGREILPTADKPPSNKVGSHGEKMRRMRKLLEKTESGAAPLAHEIDIKRAINARRKREQEEIEK